MNELDPKELERILAAEEELQPRLGFAAKVMAEVRAEETATRPLGFPWRWFVPGFLLSAALLLVAAVGVIERAGEAVPTQASSVSTLADPTAQGVLIFVGALVGSLLLAWLSTRWAVPEPMTSL